MSNLWMYWMMETKIAQDFSPVWNLEEIYIYLNDIKTKVRMQNLQNKLATLRQKVLITIMLGP